MQKKLLSIYNRQNLFRRGIALTIACAMTFPFVSSGRSVNYTKTYAAESAITYGDINNDGKINVLDMISLKSYLIENNTKGFSEKAADVNDDGEVSSFDAQEMSSYLLSQIPIFSYVTNIDSDKDGLCDYYEKEILKTKYLVGDSDEDELSDYEEVFLCGTDPLVKNDVVDELKDVDGDELNNCEEMKIGTNPLCIYSDEDELTDYDEVMKYKTNPTKSDSDEDGISDSGEIILGTNPNIDSSNEVFSQQLSSDSELLSEINSDENPYRVSVSMNSSGYINESLKIKKSVYSDFLSEKEILGEIIDVDYNNKFIVESMEIGFELKNVNNPKDYMIFKYDPSLTMLLPVKTEYDGSKLSTSDSSVGTFCVSNVAEMKETDNLISEIEGEAKDDSASMSCLSPYDAVTANGNTNIYCQFILDNSTCSIKSWSDISDSLISAVKKLESSGYNLNLKLEFCAYGYAVNITCSDSKRLDEICETAATFFNDPSVNSVNSAYNYYSRMKSSQVSDIWNQLSTYYSPSFNNTHSSSIVLRFDSNSTKDRNACCFNVGTAYCNAYNSCITAFNRSFNNVIINLEKASDKIYKIITYQNNIKKMTSYRTSLFSKILLLTSILADSTDDFDSDGTSDKSEFLTNKLVKVGTVTSKSKIYGDGATQYKNATGIDINEVEVFPLKSDPTKEDTDGDGIVDAKDANPKSSFKEEFNECFDVGTTLHAVGTNAYDIWNLQNESDDRYNSIMVGNNGATGEIGVSEAQLLEISARATLQIGAVIGGMINSAKFMQHFFANTGDKLEYDPDSLINKTSNGYKNYAENMNILRNLCESTVVDELCLNTNNYHLFDGCQFSAMGADSNREYDWWFTLGNASATMAVKCKKSGDTYSAEVVYQIVDFYDWEPNSTDRGGTVTDGEMALLHACGWAREFASLGEYNTTMTWKKGERMDTNLK